MRRAGPRKLNEFDIHPLRAYQKRNGSIPSPWVEGGWNRYLNTPQEIREAINYVEDNPLKVGLPKQSHPFVIKYPHA